MIPFAVVNTPASFQVFVNHKPRDMFNQFVFVCLDIFFFLQTLWKNTSNLSHRYFFRRFKFLKMEKCNLLASCVSRYDPLSGITMVPAKVQVNYSWPEPATQNPLYWNSPTLMTGLFRTPGQWQLLQSSHSRLSQVLWTSLAQANIHHLRASICA